MNREMRISFILKMPTQFKKFSTFYYRSLIIGFCFLLLGATKITFIKMTGTYHMKGSESMLSVDVMGGSAYWNEKPSVRKKNV